MNAVPDISPGSLRHGRPLVIELALRFFLVFVIGLATSIMLAAVVLLLAGPAQAAAAPARSACAERADTAWQEAVLAENAPAWRVFDERQARSGALPGNLFAGGLVLLLTFGVGVTARHVPAGSRRTA